MREILVVSGKGGTGKTSITAALASLYENVIVADCDVDAADLHLILEPKVMQTNDFISGHEAVVRQKDCSQCLKCIDICKFDAVKKDEDGNVYIDAIACEGCGVCTWTCPENSIDFNESYCGQLFFSEMRYGPMIHAKLNLAAENSGKLVAEVRFKAKMTSMESNIEIVIIDGPPGIGCPVMASMTGVDYVLVVAEPTLSGMHDMKRVISLAKHFGSKIFICINKYDINEELSREIEDIAIKSNIPLVGKIPYDKAFTKAQINKKTIIEYDDSSAKDAVSNMFYLLNKEIDKGVVNEKTS